MKICSCGNYLNENDIKKKYLLCGACRKRVLKNIRESHKKTDPIPKLINDQRGRKIIPISRHDMIEDDYSEESGRK